MEIRGKHVLITGAASATGVGFGVVQAVLESGGVPIINGRDPGKLAEAKRRFPAAHVVRGDVSVAEDVARMISEAAEAVGRIDCLVNNAGIGLHSAPHETAEADFDRLIGVDFRGAWMMARAWLQHVLGSDGRARFPASMVNISSVHAQRTIPGYAVYAAAKGAVDSFTRGLAVHYGRLGVRVNGVAPGYVHSEQNNDLIRNWADDPDKWVRDLIENHQALPRRIEPLDIGRVVVFLLSDCSKAITGQTLTADAGSTCLLYPVDFV